MKSGKVYLVGAGLGQVDFLTVRAARLLAQADVVLYDALADVQLLALTSGTCKHIFAGKRGGQPSTPQAEINQCLVQCCQQGHQVVRLKSGDPLVFGRALPEIQALLQAGCDFEVLPGISSALGAPLLAGIPLTEKAVGRSFTVLTGHQPAQLNWSALSQLDTLIILMGTRTLPQIIRELIAAGKTVTTGIAIIKNAGRPQQQIWSGTLTTIEKQIEQLTLSPSVIVIGKVVELAILTSSAMPVLSQTTIMITRAAEQASEFSRLLQADGATVLDLPALEIGPPSDWSPCDRAIADLGSFDWVILTSANGVKFFLDRMHTQGQDLRSLAGVKIAVVGKKTAKTLNNRGLQADFIPPNFVADSLVDKFPETLSQKRILFPRVETGGRAVLVEELSAQGATVTEVPAYESRCPETFSPEALAALRSQTVDVLTFASSKTVKNFYTLITRAEANGLQLLENVAIASIGPQTSISCAQFFGRVDIEAEEFTLDGLSNAIKRHLTQ
ncbi:MAG: uroporphyrinogen-III C-methyltransferase [Cyanobacteria bacterium P01_H01_bin.15]